MSDHKHSEVIDNLINIPQQQPIQINDEEDDHHSDFSEDFHSDPQNIDDVQLQEERKQLENLNIDQEERPPVKNPVSPYMVFVKGWKQEHPNQKMNISLMGQIWNQLTDKQKSIYQQRHKQQKIKYQQYVAYMTAKYPNFSKRSNNSANKTFFPLYRVKAIMKQDSYYTASTDNVTAMTKTVEYFGEYLLQQIKKITQGKKRVDVNDLFDCINANQSHFSFLNCLIDEHNMENQKHQQSQKKQKKKMIDIQQIEKQPKLSHKKQKKNPKTTIKPLPKGQLKLTDMF